MAAFGNNTWNSFERIDKQLQMKQLILILACWLAYISSFAQKQLWGMTAAKGSVNGVIFKTDSVGDNYTEVYTFNNTADGKDPYGSLMQASDGYLYGMTSRGGKNNYGVIFRVNPQTGVYTKKHDFDSLGGSTPYGSLCEAANGKLYGMTFRGGTLTPTWVNRGVLFEYDRTNNVFSKKIELSQSNCGSPYGSLTIAKDGKLYGLSSAGGGDATGLLFRYDVNTGIFSGLEGFISGPIWQGYAPRGGVIEASDGSFYGLSRYGGAGTEGGGVIFRYDPAGTIFNRIAAIHNFSEILPGSLQGYEMMGSLIQASNGKLYGMANMGGLNNAGVIFEFNIVNNTFAKLYDFDSTADGYNPYGSLMQASDGKLYGLTTSESGEARMFQFDITTNTLVVKANLTGTPYYTTLLESKPMPAGISNDGVADVNRVYPNPTGSIVHLNCKDITMFDYALIINPAGSIVKMQNENINAINVEGLSSGIYFIKLVGKIGIQNYKFIKQ